MKKALVGPLVVAIILLIFAAFAVYSFFLISKIDKKMNDAQATAANDATRIDGIVNFINSNLNAQNK